MFMTVGRTQSSVSERNGPPPPVFESGPRGPITASRGQPHPLRPAERRCNIRFRTVEIGMIAMRSNSASPLQVPNNLRGLGLGLLGGSATLPEAVLESLVDGLEVGHSSGTAVGESQVGV